MGKIVGVFGTAHILMAPVGIEETADKVFKGMVEIGNRVRQTRPDILVVITGDHMFNINKDFQIPICVGISDEWIPFGDLNTGARPFPGHRKLAEAFVNLAADHGYDITKSEALRPDHGVTLPLRFISSKNDIPVVPVLININMTPLPKPERFYALGDVLKKTIEQDLPSETRVAVIATGGLSHWLFVPRMGEVNVEWDRNFIAKMINGKAAELARMSASEIVEHAGNGGIEVVAWLMAAATLPGRKGQEIYYEPVPQWSTGMGGIAIVD
jgi:2'-aminobiphenyl-2,3-diol 1,2-dioxygenase large subunit